MLRPWRANIQHNHGDDPSSMVWHGWFDTRGEHATLYIADARFLRFFNSWQIYEYILLAAASGFTSVDSILGILHFFG